MFEAFKTLVKQESANVFGACALILVGLWYAAGADLELLPLLLKCLTALGCTFILGEKALGIAKWIWKGNGK